MSEFTVCRTADTYQALRYCLLLDGDRIAGGKPDYRGDNILISWNTKETYGAVDELMKENAKLRDENQSIGMAAYELGRNSVFDENAKLREDLEFERSENGWAREFLNRMGQKCGTKDCPSLVAYVTKLESENAKLRELVRDWRSLAVYGEDSLSDWIEIQDDLESRMRELGMEVG